MNKNSRFEDALVGLPINEAERTAASKGFTTRIMKQDDEYFFGTADYRTDRINLEVDNGIVTKADIG